MTGGNYRRDFPDRGTSVIKHLKYGKLDPSELHILIHAFYEILITHYTCY